MTELKRHEKHRWIVWSIKKGVVEDWTNELKSLHAFL